MTQLQRPPIQAPPVRNAVRALGLAVLSWLAFSGCQAREHPEPEVPTTRGAALDRLASQMQGTFSTAEQAQRFPDDFLDIRMVVLPIWDERQDGPWFYMELAGSNSLERPYRQRVWRLSLAEEGGFHQASYELPGDVSRFVAAWDHPGTLASLGPDDLLERRGCSSHFVADGAGFRGSTRGKGCTSSLGRASYTVTEVSLSEGVWESWDRGFAADDSQVWGSAVGPLRFLRVRKGAPR